MTSTWRWLPGPGRLTPTDRPAEVEVVDSWLVEDGRARGLAEHRRRFSASCRRFGPSDADVGRFFDAAVRTVPYPGRWFPRVELVREDGEPGFRLLVRQAPPRTASVRLWVCADRRREPTVKGPDLPWLAEVRAAAQAAGTDEAALVSPSGHVLEGGTTSLVWWRADTLCVPPAETVLPGVTRQLLVAAAEAAGTPVAEAAATPAELANLPVWAINALHGIRPVTGWAGLAEAPPVRPPGRWQRHLDDLTVPLTEGSGTDVHRVHH